MGEYAGDGRGEADTSASMVVAKAAPWMNKKMDVCHQVRTVLGLFWYFMTEATGLAGLSTLTISRTSLPIPSPHLCGLVELFLPLIYLCHHYVHSLVMND